MITIWEPSKSRGGMGSAKFTNSAPSGTPRGGRSKESGTIATWRTNRKLKIVGATRLPNGPIRALPEVDQEIGGTRPTEFARDVDELRGLIQRFSGPEAQLSGDHPLFGALSSAEWGRFSYRHADHHLRQFGT